MGHICGLVGGERGAELMALYLEYEDGVTPGRKTDTP